MRNYISNASLAKLIALLLLAVTFAGCSDNSPSSAAATTTAGTPTFTIALSRVDIGSGTSATVFATLKDGAGVGIPNAIVSFSTDGTYGKLNMSTALTDATGVAQLPSAVMLSAATNAPSGSASISASVTFAPKGTAQGQGLSASTGYAVGGAVAPTVGSVTFLSAISGTTTLVADGASSTALKFCVSTAAPASANCASGGNGISGATVSFTTGAGTLSAATANTDANGMATITLTAPIVVGSAAINAGSGGSSGSVNVTFVPGPPANVTLALSPATATALTGSTALTATVTDIKGNKISGTTVNFTTSSASGKFTTSAASGVPAATVSADTDANGVANLQTGTSNPVSVNYTAGSCSLTSCTEVLTATAGSAKGPANLTVVPAKIVVTLQPATVTAGAQTMATATVTDNAGNPVAGRAVTFASSTNSLGSSANGAYTGSTTVTTNQFGVASIAYTSGSYSAATCATACTDVLSATAPSATVDQASLTVMPAKNTLTLLPATVNAGGQTTVAATVTDNNNIPISGKLVTFASSTGSSGSSTGGTFSAATATTNIIGIASVTYTAGTCATASCTDVLTATAPSTTTGQANLTVSTANTSVASLTLKSGNTGSITADGVSYTAIQATVKTSAGAAVQGVGVAFTTTAGTLSTTSSTADVATSATTDANGVAQLFLIAPTSPGIVTVSANASGFSASTNITYTTGAPAVIGISATPSTIQPGGTTQLTISALDAQGNAAVGQTISFSTIATTDTSGGSFSSASVNTDASGIARVTYTAGTCAASPCTATLKASATNNLVSNSIPLTVNSAATVVGSLAIAATNPSIKVTGGSPTSSIINATVRDAAGAAISGATVNFATTAGTLSAATATTNSSGIASVTLTSAATVMTAVVSADISGFYSSTNVTFTAGAPSAISLNAAPNAIQPGGTSAITASVKDANGNPVAGEILTFSFAASGSGTPALSATSATTNVNGLATVDYKAGTAAGTDVITAITSNNKTPATSTPVGTNASVVVSNSSVVIGSIVTTANSSNIAVNGGTTIIRATVLDSLGAPMPGTNVDFATSAGTLTGAVTALTVTTDANGIAQTTLTSGAQLLTATVSGSAGGFTSSTQVVFTAGAAAAVSVSTAPTAVNKGGSATVSAYVADALVNGNPVAGETVSFSFTAKGSGLPTLSSATAVTNSNGVATVTYTAGTASGGVDTIQAITSTAKTGSASVTVNATAVSVVGGLALVSGATSIPTGGSAVGGTTVINATVTDTAGAAMTGQTVTFQTTAGTLSAASVATDTNGLAQVTLTSTNYLGAATITANASGFSQTVNVNFVAGSPDAVSLTATPATASSGTNSTVKATVLDAQGNPVTGQTVTFTVPTNNSGAILIPATAVTDASGVATTTYTAGSLAGTDTLKATTTNGINNTTTVIVTASTTPAAATLSLSVLPPATTSVKSDNSTSTTVTVTALSATNAATPGIDVTLSADTGILGSQTVTTGANGQATFTFSSGTASRANRTATITATAGTASAQLPVQIVGSTVTVTSSGSTIPDDGTSPITQTFVAKDAGGNQVAGAAIAVSSSGTGSAVITPVTAASSCVNTSGVTVTTCTDANGQYVVTVAGSAAGTVTVTGNSLGASAASTVTVTAAAATFGITQTTNSTGPVVTLNPSSVAMQIGDSLTVVVSAPASATVRFATTMGTWTGGNATKDVAVVAGQASAVLTTTVAGLANVQVYDPNNPTLSDNITVGMTAVTPYLITLQASPSLVAKSVGTTTGVSTMTATVLDSSGLPVGNVPVAFSIVDCTPSCNSPTGGGESVSPVVVYTAATPTDSLSLGQAQTTFTSGSLSSGANGVQIRAQVLGTAVVTGTAPSGNDAAVIIGGTAASIAFGQATKATETANGTAYTVAMSVLVTDSNGNPAPAGTVVNLSAWPIAWSTGTNCAVDDDLTFTGSIDATGQIVTVASTTGLSAGQELIGGGFPAGTTIVSVDAVAKTFATSQATPNTTSSQTLAIAQGTFMNEDVNENLLLDVVGASTEDGVREWYSSGLSYTGGTQDGLLTPVSSAGGVVPGTITTDDTGLATFSLTYPKTSAIWTVTRIRARTTVQASSALSEIQFRLSAIDTDVLPCRLGSSPYAF